MHSTISRLCSVRRFSELLIRYLALKDGGLVQHMAAQAVVAKAMLSSEAVSSETGSKKRVPSIASYALPIWIAAHHNGKIGPEKQWLRHWQLAMCARM